ncbi:MAG: glycosyltransferase family 9 protein [Phascolarctobacterium sp.]|nr:glycosyltransferase family 9 protein [Phascolarctobacterium sp.]
MEPITQKAYRVLVKKQSKYYYFFKYYLLNKVRINKYNAKRVIMFRLDLMGDCTMFTSSAIAIRNMYKDRPMTIVCLSACKAVFERLNIFDEIITVDFRPEAINFSSLEKVICKIREKEYDLLLQPQLSKFPLADILAIATKCNTRISIDTKPDNSSCKWIKIANRIYDILIDYTKDKVVSEFQYYGEFIRGLGFTDYRTSRPFLPYNGQNFLKEKYYVLYPCGSVNWKWWPAENYAMVADYIYNKTGYKGVILGVESEKQVALKIINSSVCKTAGLLDFSGKTTVNDVVDLIGNAEFVISNDTSGVHIASATNTPSIALIGGGHFGRFLPYGLENVKPSDNLPFVAYEKMECFNCDWHWHIINKRNRNCLDNILQGNVIPCIANIGVEKVKCLVDKILQKGKHK